MAAAAKAQTKDEGIKPQAVQQDSQTVAAEPAEAKQPELEERKEYKPSTTADEGYISELRLIEITEEIGSLYNICPELLQAICYHESSYYIAAENGDCKGLMQINTAYTAERMERLGVTDIHDEYSNILLAADYIAELRDTTAYGYDIYYVLMRYNMKTETANELYEAGTITDYAKSVAAYAVELERLHGK